MQCIWPFWSKPNTKRKRAELPDSWLLAHFRLTCPTSSRGFRTSITILLSLLTGRLSIDSKHYWSPQGKAGCTHLWGLHPYSRHLQHLLLQIPMPAVYFSCQVMCWHFRFTPWMCICYTIFIYLKIGILPQPSVMTSSTFDRGYILEPVLSIRHRQSLWICCGKGQKPCK